MSEQKTITNPLELQKEALVRAERMLPEIKSNFQDLSFAMEWFAKSEIHTKGVVVSHSEILAQLLQRVEKLEKDVQALQDERHEEILRSIDYSM